jgi:hypothetical protein
MMEDGGAPGSVIAVSSIAPLPQHESARADRPGTAARVLNWTVFLAFGFFARLWLVGLWIFSDLLGDAFDSWVLPVLGFVLVPWTTLTYAFMWTISSDKVAGWEWGVVVIALLFDWLFWAWSRRVFV